MSDRYVISNNVEHACCIEASVTDTTKPVIVGGEHWRDRNGNLEYQAVCECFSKEDAELICAALNAYVRPS